MHSARTETPIHRKWLRLSLRSALFITTIACLWLGWQAHLGRRQARALERIHEIGGNVQADGDQSSFLARLARKYGLASRRRVTDVSFLGPTISDSDIDDIAGCASMLPYLESITLMETGVTSAGENRLRAKLPELDIQVIAPILEIPTRQLRR